MRIDVGESHTCPCGHSVTRVSSDHYQVSGYSVLTDKALLCSGGCGTIIPTEAVVEFADLEGKLLKEVTEGKLAHLYNQRFTPEGDEADPLDVLLDTPPQALKQPTTAKLAPKPIVTTDLEDFLG